MINFLLKLIEIILYIALVLAILSVTIIMVWSVFKLVTL